MRGGEQGFAGLQRNKHRLPEPMTQNLAAQLWWLGCGADCNHCSDPSPAPNGWGCVTRLRPARSEGWLSNHPRRWSC